MRLTLGQAADVRLGRQRAPQYEAGDSVVPYLRSANVTDGVLDLTDVKSMNFTPEEQRVFSLAPGDVLVTEGSGSRDTVGTSAVWTEDLPGPVCFQNTLLRLRPRDGVTDGMYLAWWARHARASGQIAAVSSGANILHIGSDGLKRLRITVPSLSNQRRIADFLDDRVARIDRIIAARQKQSSLALAAAERAVMDVLLGPDIAQLPEAPWFDVGRRARAKKLGGSWSVIDCKHRTPSYVAAGYPVISPGDISADRLDLGRATRFVNETDYKDLADDLRRCRPGDLVYSRNASAGIAAFVETTDPFTMGQDVCRITSTAENQLYLAYCLNYLTRPQLEAARVGSTFTRINVAQIKSIVVPYRHPTTQRAIARECDATVRAASGGFTMLAHSIDLFTKYRASLITAAVTGELDVTTAGSGLPG